MLFLLKAPLIYEAFQILTGFSSVRSKMFAEYLLLRRGDRVFDVGCGPGKISTYLPPGIEYHGFDVDQRYVDYATKKYGAYGDFHCCPFDDNIVGKFGKADVILLNGVLHHLCDDLVDQILETAEGALVNGGSLFTLDGCYREGQSVIARILLKLDRGSYVRSANGYNALLQKHFPNASVHIREDISLIPYSFVITNARKEGPIG